jgi:hypothetical protein
MIKQLYLTFLALIILGCNNSTNINDAYKDSVIRLQEERINQLEKKLETSIEPQVDTVRKPNGVYNQLQNSEPIILDYFTIGSTEDEVLTIQGQPTTIQKLSNFKLFFYGTSMITFSNGKVESFSNDGNLKVKVIANAQKKENNSYKKEIVDNSSEYNNEIKHGENGKKIKQVNKYIYFTFMNTDLQIDVDPISGNLKSRPRQYSQIFSISDYTYEKEEALEFCLTKNYKEWTGEKVQLLPHSYDSRNSALMDWTNEKGRLFSSRCGELMEIGIMAQ